MAFEEIDFNTRDKRYKSRGKLKKKNKERKKVRKKTQKHCFSKILQTSLKRAAKYKKIITLLLK